MGSKGYGLTSAGEAFHMKLSVPHKGATNSNTIFKYTLIINTIKYILKKSLLLKYLRKYS